LPSNTPPIFVDSGAVLRAFQQANKGAAPGPTGISGIIWYQLIQDTDIRDSMTVILNTIINGTWDDPVAKSMLTAANGILLEKEERQGGVNEEGKTEGRLLEEIHELEASGNTPGRLRILSMVEHLMKVAGLLGLNKLDPKRVEEIMNNVQLAIGTSGGTEIAIQRLQEYIFQTGADPDVVVIFLDLANAYMMASRKVMLETLFKYVEFQSVWRIARWMLSTPNPRYFMMEDGNMYTVIQYEGGPQGDPLMPFLFSVLMLVLHDLLNCKAKAGYLDDTAFGDKVQVVAPIYRRILKECRNLIGADVNPTKTVILSVCEQPSDDVIEFVRSENLILHRHHTTYLGGIIGTKLEPMSEFVVNEVRSHAPLFRILSHPAMPHYIAERCTSVSLIPKMTHLLRSHHPEVTRAGTRLFDRALKEFVKSKFDLPELDRDNTFIKWAQIELPKRLGGLGLPNLESHRFIMSLAGLGSAAADLSRIQTILDQEKPPPKPPDKNSSYAADRFHCCISFLSEISSSLASHGRLPQSFFHFMQLYGKQDIPTKVSNASSRQFSTGRL